MKIKKYGFALLMICLIVFTILLSVKHEQKRREKMALQEEEPSEEVAVQAEEETGNIEPDAVDEQKETGEKAERAKQQIRCEHHLYREMLSVDYSIEEIPFVNAETFALIREAYENVDFSSEFEKGDPAVYEECNLAFRRMIRNEAPFLDRETGKEVYIKDRTASMYISDYYFFDMNGDGLPELCIDGYLYDLVFTYDLEKDQCILWKQLEYMTIIGTRKAEKSYEDFGNYVFDFVQLDTNGEVEYNTMFFSQPADLFYHNDLIINMVMFPNYADSEKRCEITEEMKQQGVFEESSGQWFFRITDEQFEELEKIYMEALGSVWKERKKVTYTYEELFGAGYVNDKLYGEIKDICENIDFAISFDPGDVSKNELYKEKYKNLLDTETITVRLDGPEEKWYVFDLGEFRTDIFLKWRDYNNEHKYYFFDMTGDGNPELCVTDNKSFFYVFQYDEEKDQIILWKEYIPGTNFLMGTLNVGFSGETGGDGMIRFDENGDRVWFVRFVAIGGEPARSDSENYGYLVYLPEYIELTYDMKKQAIYDAVEDRYYFRVSGKQFNELTRSYYAAVKEAQAALDEVTYTYTELFD